MTKQIAPKGSTKQASIRQTNLHLRLIQAKKENLGEADMEKHRSYELKHIKKTGKR